MKFCAWFLIVAVTTNCLLMPFVFGKPRPAYSPLGWVGAMLNAFIIVSICGRVLGWW